MENGKYLLPGIVLSHKPLSQRLQVSFFEIEVRSCDHLPSLVSDHPIDNLRSIRSEESTILSVERLAVLA